MKSIDDIVGIVSVYKNGEHLCTGKNTITNAGRAWMSLRLVENSNYTAASPVHQMRFGGSDTATSTGQTALVSDFYQTSSNSYFTPKDNLTRPSGDAFVIQPDGTADTFSFFTNSSLSSSATTMTVQHPHLFPDANTADTNSHFFLKITDASGSPGYEIVKVTNVSAHTVTHGTGATSGDTFRTATFTIVRGEQSTTARAFSGPNGSAERNTIELYEMARCTHVFQGEHTTSSAITVKEAGLFAKTVAGGQQVETEVLVSRIVFDTQFDYSLGDTFDIVWDLKFI